jgi:predicted amidohydrolase YtcJ
MKNLLFIFAAILILLGCKQQPENSADSIYFGGDIITMEGDSPEYVEAVAVKDGKILFVGSKDEAMKLEGSETKLFDLRGKTMMPGFIEQHLHPFLGGLFLTMPAIAPENWEVPGKTWKAATSHEDYMTMLKTEFAKHQDSNSIFWTWGFHQYYHGELNRAMLDEVSSITPIVVWHRSCHEFYCNTAFLKRFNITDEDLKNTSAIARQQINLKKGHFYENGAMVYLLPKIYNELASPDRMKKGLKLMVEMLHSNGITAYNEPGALMDLSMAKLYSEVLGAPDVPMLSTFIVEGNTLYMSKGDSALTLAEKTVDLLPREGKVYFFTKQIKLLMDGAIISQLMQMKDGYLDGHSGEWMLKPELMEPATRLFWNAGYQIHIHVNGDLGLEVVLNAIEKCMKENPRENHRTVIVHFANSTDELVNKAAKLGCIISANPYYVTGFSNKYSQIGLGTERATAMVRLAPAEKLGIPISLHSDLPMGPADPLFLVWCAVTRRSNEGNVVRPDLAISLHTALKGITIEAAYSWQMENEIGSIKESKKANFTLLKENPYKVEIDRLKDIEVAATVFEGKLFSVNTIN